MEDLKRRLTREAAMESELYLASNQTLDLFEHAYVEHGLVQSEDSEAILSAARKQMKVEHYANYPEEEGE